MKADIADIGEVYSAHGGRLYHSLFVTKPLERGRPSNSFSERYSMPVDQPVRAWERDQYYDGCSQYLRARSSRRQLGANSEPEHYQEAGNREKLISERFEHGQIQIRVATL
jgi:hypothetical protein